MSIFVRKVKSRCDNVASAFVMLMGLKGFKGFKVLKGHWSLITGH